MNEVLSLIAQKLNQAGISWGIGGSLLLKLHKLEDHPNDIDIIVNEADVLLAVEQLRAIGVQGTAERRAPFRTKHFYRFRIGNTDLDVMGGFAIEHKHGIYTFPFNDASIVSTNKINGASLPFCSLEDWFVLYSLMPGRADKANRIYEYLLKNEAEHKEILQMILSQPLPESLARQISVLIEKNA